jgi:hypothetical protein
MNPSDSLSYSTFQTQFDDLLSTDLALCSAMPNHTLLYKGTKLDNYTDVISKYSITPDMSLQIDERNMGGIIEYIDGYKTLGCYPTISTYFVPNIADLSGNGVYQELYSGDSGYIPFDTYIGESYYVRDKTSNTEKTLDLHNALNIKFNAEVTFDSSLNGSDIPLYVLLNNRNCHYLNNTSSLSSGYLVLNYIPVCKKVNQISVNITFDANTLYKNTQTGLSLYTCNYSAKSGTNYYEFTDISFYTNPDNIPYTVTPLSDIVIETRKYR